MAMIGELARRIRRVVRARGYDVSRYDPRCNFLALRKLLLDRYAIDVVLDVGANVGAFARQMRDIGYSGRIVSFEPVAVVFKELSARTAGDSDWVAMNCALGDVDGTATINIAANNAESSSLLEMLPRHLEAAAASQFVAQERIQVKRLDGLFDSVCAGMRNVYLKIDTQGFEKQVLEGAGGALDRIDTLQLELSLVPLYRNDTSFLDMWSYLRDRGFEAVAFEPGFLDIERGQMLQVDGIFHRFRPHSPLLKSTD